MNQNEKNIRKKYLKEGWKCLRGGSPDFVFVKTKNGEVKDVIFVEVKYGYNKLSYEQAVYRKVLEFLGVKYKIEYIHTDQNLTNHSLSRTPPHSSGQSFPDQSKTKVINNEN